MNGLYENEVSESLGDCLNATSNGIRTQRDEQDQEKDHQMNLIKKVAIELLEFFRHSIEEEKVSRNFIP
jgi:hypothetical protein